MTAWTSGYIADIGYTYGYYTELNPLRAELPLLATGALPPRRWETACELGFGQGVSVNVHAAASTTHWWGTDFNPAHAAFAQEMAEAGGAGAQLYDEAFAEFCARPDLPEFDFIGIHGIWSWVSEANRALLVDFLRRKLKVGGVVFLSYNTLPGWAPMVPMRHLMEEHVRVMGAPAQPRAEKIDAALDFADKLLAAGSAYARINPVVKDRLAALRGKDRGYLAHEYFNRDWLPMTFAQAAERLEPAKLTYGCSAAYLENFDSVNMPPEAAQFLHAIADPMFRESVRDHLVNQQFRRDYWIRGARRPVGPETSEALGRMRFSLLRAPAAIPMTYSQPGSTATVTLQETVYRPLIDAVAARPGIEIAELASLLGPRGISFPQLVQAVMLLDSRGDLARCQPEDAQRAVQARCDALNRWAIDKARGTGELGHLASPATGGGVAVTRPHQLYLAAYLGGERDPDKLARACWGALRVRKELVLKDGKPLQTEEENVAYLVEDARKFVAEQVPALRTLKVIPASAR